jgi:NTP pyrophosphatase (non-canonical NTP hydrolase)
MMEVKEYQEKVSRTMVDLPSVIDNELHMALGMVTEAGEFADVYKKALAYGKAIDYINLKEEIGDILWYIANFCNLQGWNMGDIMETNIKKLEARYPEKFTEDKAINRDLTFERKILEL